MRFAILIDYANLFISIKNNLKLNSIDSVEQEVCKTLDGLKKFVSAPNEYYKKGIDVVSMTAYALDDESLGMPERRLPNLNIDVKRIHDPNARKTLEMKKMNQSRLDDELLMSDGLALARSGSIDGILVTTNDGDYSSLGEKLGYMGRDFWIGVYEGLQSRASSKLKNSADMVLHLQDIAAGIDEADPLPLTDEASYPSEDINGPRLLIYRHGRVIINYPVNKKVIGIGRRSSSRFYFPQVDLTDYDPERIMSRQHAVINRVNNRLIFSVHPNCTRGTWLNRIPLRPYQQFVLKPGMLVVLGDKDGFGLRYVED